MQLLKQAFMTILKQFFSKKSARLFPEKSEEDSTNVNKNLNDYCFDHYICSGMNRYGKHQVADLQMQR